MQWKLLAGTRARHAPPVTLPVPLFRPPNNIAAVQLSRGAHESRRTRRKKRLLPWVSSSSSSLQPLRIPLLANNRGEVEQPIWFNLGEVFVLMEVSRCLDGVDERNGGRFAEIIALKMDGDEAKESAMDGLASETASRIPDVSKKQPKRKRTLVDEEVASAGLQGEIDALFDYYKEVSGGWSCEMASQSLSLAAL
uniref:Uncharacterized protein n=1 Tax=Oryza sativa subsp. japonica TaxID=39947 RepID=Q6YU45_ORYSJ|nr:hypothetical protein [Oryza sativa Japonica Group]